MRVNLLEKDEGLKINWLEIVAVVVVILVFAGPGLHFYSQTQEINRLETRRDSWQDRINALRPEENRFYELEREIDNFRLPEEVEVQRYAIAPAFREFGVILPEEINFENISYSQGRMSIVGNASDIETILDMISNIFESDVFSLVSLERFQQDDLYNFDLEVRMHTREELN